MALLVGWSALVYGAPNGDISQTLYLSKSSSSFRIDNSCNSGEFKSAVVVHSKAEPNLLRPCRDKDTRYVERGRPMEGRTVAGNSGHYHNHIPCIIFLRYAEIMTYSGTLGIGLR